MNQDVLVLVVPLRYGLGYPTVNMAGANGHRAGKKSPAYKALAYDVEEAARAAVDAGWKMVEYPCLFICTYYSPHNRVVDGINIGGCEANALTRAGVWADDTLARHPLPGYEPNDPGPERVVIIVQRRAPPVGAVPRAPRKVKPKDEPPPVKAGDDVREVVVNGKIEKWPLSEILRRSTLKTGRGTRER